MGISIAVIEPGANPYITQVEPDEKGSYLKAFQEKVGGLVEFLDVLWGDNPALIVNEEYLLNGSVPNRAIYANEHMHAAGYIDQMTYTHPVEVGELYTLVFGTFIAVSFDADGNPRSLPMGEWAKVQCAFAGEASIQSPVTEILRIREEMEGEE